jgi:hypothetical protein
MFWRLLGGFHKAMQNDDFIAVEAKQDARDSAGA